MAPDAPVMPTIRRFGSISGGVEIVNLHQHAARHRFERAVKRTGRTAGVGVRLERFAAIALFVVADDQIAGKQKNLFPIFMNEWLGGVNARLKPQKTGAAAALVHLVEGA